jgi:L-fucose mutarotase/ribose pyranase (RbsD/FucU family)
MDSIHFVVNYPTYLDEIEQVIKPELKSVVDDLRHIDPHDLITPDTWFPTESSAKGLVWEMFVRRVYRDFE